MKPLVIISTTLLILNIFIFVNRDNFGYTNAVAYNQLYPNFTKLPVKEIELINDSTVQYNLLNPQDTEQVFITEIDGLITSKTKQSNPTLALIQGLHTYYTYNNNIAETLFTRIEFIPKVNKYYQQPFFGIYKTTASSVSLEDVESDKEIFKNISADEIAILHKLNTDSVGIATTDNEQTIIAKICTFLHKKIFKARGIPTDSVLQLNPYQQYVAATKGFKIWCGNYANIFNVFLKLNNIDCRSVFINGNHQKLNGSAHVCNEYFLKDKKQWVAADIMFNNINYSNANGEFLNVVQIKNSLQNDSTILCTICVDSSIKKIPLTVQEQTFFDYYGRDKNLLYVYNNTDVHYNGSWLKRICNYALPVSRYVTYSDNEIANNRNFYIKQILFFMLVIFSVAMVLLFLKNKFIQ